MITEVEEGLLRIIAAGLAELPQITRIPVDPNGTTHIELVTRELHIPADVVDLVHSAAFLEQCSEVAEAHGCVLTRNLDRTLTFRKPAHAL